MIDTSALPQSISLSIGKELTFSAAADHFIELKTFHGASGETSTRSRSRYVADRTLRDYRQYAKTLRPFFGALKIADIHLSHFRSYQEFRAERACAAVINKELGFVQQVLRRALLWTPLMDDHYQPLIVQESDVQRSMTPEEQEAFLEIAASRQEWRVVHWFSLLALHTTCHNLELRKLQVGDINLPQAVLQVRNRGAKRPSRVRTIPLDENAIYAGERLLERAREIGATAPTHYVFPFRHGFGAHDLTRPMTEFGLWKPFDEVRKAAGVPWLRIHDLRHTAITRLAEAGTPIAVIMSMAGHLSARMTAHYTSVSDSAKRLALGNAYSKHAQPQRVPMMPKASRMQAEERRPDRHNSPTMIMALSTPDGADVELDGVFVGNAPSELCVEPGPHAVRFSKRGFKPFERTISIAAGSKVTITAELEESHVSA